VFTAQTQWIVANKNLLNIKYVLHLGDITNNNYDEQWEHARASFKILDDANMPYAFVPGNHDYRPRASRTTGINTCLPYAKYAVWLTFGSAMISPVDFNDVEAVGFYMCGTRSGSNRQINFKLNSFSATAEILSGN